MRGVDASFGILAHIRHAERWLRRARSDCERGDARQAVLRLLLAEAEIRRARESSAGMATCPRRRPTPSSWAILGTVAVAGLILAAYALARPTGSSPAATVPSVVPAAPAVTGPNGVLRFESGQVLPLVAFPQGVRPVGRTGSGAIVHVDGPDLFWQNGDDGPTLVTFH